MTLLIPLLLRLTTLFERGRAEEELSADERTRSEESSPLTADQE